MERKDRECVYEATEKQCNRKYYRQKRDVYKRQLHEYEPVIMKNAIIYSDNIYFAKAALKIGSENFMNTLNEIGFKQNMPFEIAMQESTYSNTDKIETEIQLADSCLLYTSQQ